MVKYELMLRASFLSYLHGENKNASEYLSAATQLIESSEHKPKWASEIKRLRAVVEGSAKPLTPSNLFSTKQSEARALVAYGDLNLMMLRFNKAQEVYINAMKIAEISKTSEQSAYVTFRQAQALEFMDKHTEAIELLKSLKNARYKGCSWAAEGIFRMGLWSFNRTQNPNESIEHYEFVMKAFPKAPVAEKCLYYYALDCLKANRVEDAKLAFEKYIQRYASGEWANLIKNYYIPKLTRIQ